VVTRIEQDGTMQRRVVDTAQGDDARLWEDLATRALASVPPYQPIPGTAVYHVSVDGRTVQVGEYDLDGALRDLATLVLATGEDLAQLARSRPAVGHAVAAPEGSEHG
jgi:class 3 adenylate cyclase